MTYEEWAVKVVRALCKEEKDWGSKTVFEEIAGVTKSDREYLDYYKENRKPSDAAYQGILNTLR